MRFVRFFLALVLTVGLVWLLQTPQRIGSTTLPALGTFFNPFSGFWQNAEPVAVFSSKNIQIPGLLGQVEVVYDDLLVPHIFAENQEDALRAQGYVTARHRLWQMDIAARKASGRLSEVLGARTLNIDRVTRRRGMGFAAENAVRGWSKSTEGMRLLEAYCAGVNAYVAQLRPEDYPLEFKLLGYAPEPWSPLKTALLVEAMAETLCSGENDLGSTETLDLLGRDTFDYLYPEWNSKQQPIIPDTGQWRSVSTFSAPSTFSASSTSSAPSTSSAEDYILGSNNWAVAGSNTASGNPILCNDPHLNLTLPSIWFQIQMHTPEQNCYGVSLQGVPGIIIGFNEDMAWGVTNAGHDVADWYRIRWADADHTRYLLDGDTRAVELRVEEIKIKGEASLLDTVRYTVWGPVVYDHDPEHPLRDCALRWATHDEPAADEMRTFLFLNSGKTYDDYRRALKGYESPAQNFVFATRTGDIAITVQGKLPLRTHEQGRFLLDGSKQAGAWGGFIPPEHIPAMRNPARGFVFSANQHSTPPTYPYYYLSNDFDDYRGRHIFDRLSAMKNATADSMKTIQLDNFSQRAADALPVMLRLLDRDSLDAEGRKIVAELTAWDFRYEATATAAPLYEAWFDSCYLRTWDEMIILREQGRQVSLPERWRFIELLETDPENTFFDRQDTPQRETARDVAQDAFDRMLRYFRENPERRVTWGLFRGFAVKHLAQIDAFSRLDVVVGGHGSTPNAISRSNGPSWRMIVELGEQVRAQGVYPGGQSGNPGSRYYDNMVDAWAAGKYYELLFLDKPDAIPAGREVARQTLSPQ
ncbi:MAG: penicillin acylase family protein [Lewinellaceae bacterium]|nr:penicillin acylase family protein [Lewinellaceae bacterium]